MITGGVADVLGIGFGPANLALAVALDEMDAPLRAHFLERSPDSAWQSGMLLDGSDIQNSPFRDLVSLRNPRSRYSFMNYLHDRGRLVEHLNVPARFPLRREYAEYIEWVARFFSGCVTYAADVRAVRAEPGSEALRHLVVTTADGRQRRARALVVGSGRSPYVPPAFASLPQDRVFHLTEYVPRIKALRRDRSHDIAVVGASQSAVEIVLDLLRRLPDATITMYIRQVGLRLKDTSPFSEEAFFPEHTDYYYGLPRDAKRAVDAYVRPTNYSSVDGDVLDALYREIYEQRLVGAPRVLLRTCREITQASVESGRVRVVAHEPNTGEREAADHDVVVLATGFRNLGPGSRDERLPPLLEGLAEQLEFDEEGYLNVTRDYRIHMQRPDLPPVFLNGLCESSHGIGDAGSFSLLSLRAETLAHGLLEALDHSMERVSA